MSMTEEEYGIDRNDCLFLFAPANKTYNNIKYIFTDSVLWGKFDKEPYLLYDDMAFYKQSDVDKFGVDFFCKEIMKSKNYDTCMVLRFNKVDLIGGKWNLLPTPILFQRETTMNDGKLLRESEVQHNYLYGVYSSHTMGFLANPNYSDVGDCTGIYCEEQIHAMKKRQERGQFLANVLERNEKIVNDIHNLSQYLTNPRNANALRSEFQKDYISMSKFCRDLYPNRRKLTPQEFDRIVAERRASSAGSGQSRR